MGFSSRSTTRHNKFLEQTAVCVSKSLLLIKAARVVGHSVFCHHSCSVIPILSPFSFLVFHSHVFSCFVIPILWSRLAKIKKTHMSSRGFEPVTSQAKAKSSYSYTTCVFMSTSMTGNTSTTSLTKLTFYPCTMRSSK
jgi:hypothetical protein